MIGFPLHSAFLALPMEGDAKENFRVLSDRLKDFDFLALQQTDTPHLTLNYWKEIWEIEYRPILEQCGKIAAATMPFALTANGFDTFGKKGEENVLYLTVAFSPELATVKKKCPWPNKYDEFRPHITLARIKNPQKFQVYRKEIEKLLDGINFPFDVPMLRLYGYVEGKKQTPLHDFPFAAA